MICMINGCGFKLEAVQMMSSHVSINLGFLKIFYAVIKILAKITISQEETFSIFTRG